MTRKAVRTVVLSSTADFFNGMATAWAFACYDAVFRNAWLDLLYAFLLAILASIFALFWNARAKRSVVQQFVLKWLRDYLLDTTWQPFFQAHFR